MIGHKQPFDVLFVASLQKSLIRERNHRNMLGVIKPQFSVFCINILFVNTPLTIEKSDKKKLVNMCKLFIFGKAY